MSALPGYRLSGRHSVVDTSFYHAFEGRYRGSRESITSRLTVTFLSSSRLNSSTQRVRALIRVVDAGNGWTS
uniref:Uncharacterized protein n=1 Tax=mine drainage metagenome TaxID=410659 RepID=E6QXB0_9ZZZZ